MKILSLYEKTQNLMISIHEEMETLDLENPDEEYLRNELAEAMDQIDKADSILARIKEFPHEPF